MLKKRTKFDNFRKENNCGKTQTQRTASQHNSWAGQLPANYKSTISFSFNKSNTQRCSSQQNINFLIYDIW